MHFKVFKVFSYSDYCVYGEEKKKKGTGENILADDIACTCFGILCLNGINIEKNNYLSKTTVTNGDQ